MKITNPILLNYSERTPCKEIFQAICDEIGNHYSKKGFRYAKSQPKLTIQTENLKLEIKFYSSGSNMPGSYVNLEILPAFYSSKLAKMNKSKGFLFGHTGLFYHKYTDNPKLIRVNKIFGEVIDREDEYSYESKVIDSNNCNLYGINELKLNQIIEFIDSKIVVWLKKLENIDEINQFVQDASPTRKSSFEGNSEFLQYKTVA